MQLLAQNRYLGLQLVVGAVTGGKPRAVQEKLNVALGAMDGRHAHVEREQALGGKEFNRRHERIAADGGVGHDTALAHQRSRRLKLGLYKRAKRTRRLQARQHGVDDIRDTRKRHVADSQVDRAAIAELGQLRHVGALVERHALVLAKRPIKLSATHIDRNDCGGAALEQAIGKAARGASHIEAGKARGIDTKRIERALELEPAAPNVGNTTLHVQRQARRHLKAR